MNIAICDDDLNFANKLENICYSLSDKVDGLNLDIDVYQSGEEFLDLVDFNNLPSILFIDIEMKKINGIEVARKLREFSEEILIIYITSYDTYTLESFEVRPFRYLLKPIDEKEISKTFYDSIDYINKSYKYIFFKKGKDIIQVFTSNIISILSESGRKLRVITDSNPLGDIYYGKIKDIENEINPLYFIKINRGIIINLNKVKSLNNHDVIMLDDKVYPISKNRRKCVLDFYSDFVSKQIGL